MGINSGFKGLTLYVYAVTADISFIFYVCYIISLKKCKTGMQMK